MAAAAVLTLKDRRILRSPKTGVSTLSASHQMQTTLQYLRQLSIRKVPRTLRIALEVDDPSARLTR
jgi:hypothetical protein